MEMKWLKRDLKKLANYTRKFNTSITKLTAKYPEISDAGLFPEKISAKEIREKGLTRKEFNNLLRSIDRWFKKGNRDIITRGGVKMTRWEYKEAIYENQRLAAIKKDRIKKSPVSVRQQSARENQTKTVGEKLKEIENRMRKALETDGEFGMEEARSAWITFTKKVRAQASPEYQEKMSMQYYYNYNQSIYENFSDPNNTILSNFLEDFRLSGDELYEITGNYPSLDIEFMYSPEEEDFKVEYIMEMLPQAVKKLFPVKYKEWQDRMK